jgi:hypothetical protein
MGKVILYRFFFDRDIRDRAAWVYRGHNPDKDIPE